MNDSVNDLKMTPEEKEEVIEYLRKRRERCAKEQQRIEAWQAAFGELDERANYTTDEDDNAIACADSDWSAAAIAFLKRADDCDFEHVDDLVNAIRVEIGARRNQRLK